MPATLPEPVARLLKAADDNDIDAFLAGFNGPSHFSFRVDGDRVARMTIRA
jgi:hypothetical protein